MKNVKEITKISKSIDDCIEKLPDNVAMNDDIVCLWKEYNELDESLENQLQNLINIQNHLNNLDIHFNM